MILSTVVTGFGGHAIALGIAGVGSAIGTGIAAQGAMGLWKQSIKEKKKLPSLALAMVGMPLSQVIYGMIFMNSLQGANLNPDSYLNQMIFAFCVGLAIAASAVMQGKAGAAACSNLAVDDKQGAGMYIAAMGVIETVALLSMVFGMGAIPGS
ncbi:V-type ATP synthase subunit K [Mangrovibacterium diazotrophicum]|uniref:V/A-type H+-transporting ATPase subunit K n=1 Tax=Mangrovibacterium diazotrophicum TaxID=1261403 RepID=A0A419W4H2_9BACT|nr:V-type ATP synthase subunit K [Mangrovibacterium diazotrophicum]RKD90349.1 V/A-type H+-transporting ATPase subunit K [Mangrovibacterium diazotrophicum]